MSERQPAPPDAGAEELDPQLAALVDAILDGGTVDWASCAEGASARFRDELRVVADLAGVHRSLASAEVARESPAFPPSLPWDAGALTITAFLGSGAFGEVFRAWDTQLHRDVALKLLFRDRGHEHEADLFLEEGRLLAKVRHPNVITVHGAERLDGRVGIITEFVDGRTLAEIVRDGGPLPPEQVLSIGRDLCRALTAVHQAGLLHCDIKPQNVMRAADGRIVLMDFGAGHRGEAVARALAGTPLFLAPEVLEDGPATVQSDLYSLGVLLQYLLTGSHRVTGGSLAEIRRAHATGQRTSFRDVRPALPKTLVSVLERALAPDPQARYSSAQEMARALERARTPRLRPHPAVAFAVLLLVAGAGSWTAWRAMAPPGRQVAFQSRDWVLVAQFDNETGEPQFDRTLQHAITHELSNSTHVNVVPRVRIADVLRLMALPESTVVDASIGREVALRDGSVRVVVAGRMEKVGGLYLLTAQLSDPDTGTVIGSRREEARAAADVPDSVRALTNWIRGQLGEPGGDIQASTLALEKVTTPSLQALSLYSEACDAGGLGRWTESEELVRAALDHDPDFASAHIWLAWSLHNSGKTAKEYLPHAQRAFGLAARTAERERYFIRGSYYQLSGDDERALAAYEALVRLHPHHPWGLGNLQATAGRLGRPREEVAAVIVRMADARPNDFRLQTQAAQELTAVWGPGAAKPYAERARSLLTSTSPVGTAEGINRTWVAMFPVHELWSQRRFADAAAALNRLGWQPEIENAGDWARSNRATLHLTLGQNRRADESLNRVANPDHRKLQLALHALAREDLPAMAVHLRSYRGRDLAVASMLVRAGEFTAARQFLDRLAPHDRHGEWSKAELAIAETGDLRHRGTLETGIRVLRELTGVRAFFYSETLAEGLVKAGDVRAAIEVLETTGQLRQRLYSRAGANGYLWMRTQKRLADLYRITGRIDEAKDVEADLRSHLAGGDPDHPLSIALQRLDR